MIPIYLCDDAPGIRREIRRELEKEILISGYDKKRDANVVLIELKRWDELRAVPGRDGLVETYTGNGLRRACLNEREKENSHDRGNH